jgi:hypothetical protein
MSAHQNIVTEASPSSLRPPKRLHKSRCQSQIEMSLAPQSRNVTWASDAGHGLRCGREAGLSVDGTEAEPATVRRGQAPEPRSGAP